MEGRGRKSAASLTVVPAGIPARMEPPQGLPDSQAGLWREIVQDKPVDWFAPDNAPLLVEYVRAVDMCNALAMQIEATLAGGDPVETALLLKGFLDMRDKEAKRATSIATKLRLTQQSRYTPQAANTANKKASGARPWHPVSAS
jgi:hypothetical protein